MLKITVQGGLHYFTLFEHGLPTETMAWHSIVEDCEKGEGA